MHPGGGQMKITYSNASHSSQTCLSCRRSFQHRKKGDSYCSTDCAAASNLAAVTPPTIRQLLKGARNG